MKTIKILVLTLLSTNLLFAQSNMEVVNPSTIPASFAIKGISYGYGIQGIISGNSNKAAVGVLGQIGLSNIGSAGRFENLNINNTDANALEVYSKSAGNAADNTIGNAASFRVDNTESVSSAVRGEVNSIFANFGTAGIYGISSGTGGKGGMFYASHRQGGGPALLALTDGLGNAITAKASRGGNGVETVVDSIGNALYAWIPYYSMGRAGKFEILNEANYNEVVTVQTVGDGTALSAKVDRVTGTSPALKGEVNSQFANFGTAGVYGISSGTGGVAGLFHSSNPAGTGAAIIALTAGSNSAVIANAAGNGDGIEGSTNGSGNAIYGYIPSFGTGRAGRFENKNTTNGNPVVHIINSGTGNAALINHVGASGSIAVFQSASVNVARINKAGRGFFDGGTQASGADLAELFDVTGNRASYEEGDILIISKSSDREVEKSNKPYSSLVAGVYATKPGVLLTEENIDSDISDKVPMGVVGVIPTKVCLEGGIIERGDLLVTSSVPGVAMKADPEKVKIGQVLGKALQGFNSETIGKIKVLVNVK